MTMWRFGYPTLAAVIWAGSPIAAKLSIDLIHPLHIAFLRWLIALAVLTPFVLPSLFADARVLLRNLAALSLLGLLGMVTYQTLAYFAVRFTTVTNCSILDATIPILVTIIEAAWLRRRQPVRVVAGCAIAFLGIVVLLSRGRGPRDGIFTLNLGDGLILLSCLSYALYSVLVNRIAPQVTRWHSLYMQIFAAVVILSPFYLADGPTVPSATSVPILLYVGVLSSVLAPYAWMQGIHLLGSARTSVYLNIVPVLTLLLAVVVLGETLTYVEVAGGLLSFFGLVLSQSSA